MNSASGIALELLCGWGFRPDVKIARPPPTDDQKSGTAVHALIGSSVSGERFEIAADEVRTFERDDVHALLESWRANWWARESSRGWRSEIAFAVDPFASVAREIETKSHRDYGALGPSEIPGTADAVRLVDGRLSVRDWKCGFESVETRGNAQLLTLALAAACVYRPDAIDIGIVHVRPDRCDEIVVDVNEDELEGFRIALTLMLKSRATAQARFGSWCRDLHCKAYGQCPATESALDLVAESPRVRLPIVLDSSEIQGPDHARELYEFARHAEARLKMLRSALEEHATVKGPIDLGRGRVWGPVVSRRESIDAASVDLSKCDDQSREILVDAMSMKITKTKLLASVRKFAGSNAAKRAIATRKIYELLRSDGAISDHENTTFKELKGGSDEIEIQASREDSAESE